jgi:hypothetical protein
MKQSRPVIAVLVVFLFACAVPTFAQTTKPKPKPKPPAVAKPAPPEAPKPPPPPPSVSVTTKYASAGETVVTTVHSSGARQRFEFANGRALILQCDAGKAIQVSDLAKSYAASNLADASASPPPAEEAKGGPVALKTVITDMGERREIFGLQARRVKTVTTREPSAGACDKSHARSETDGWYADLPVPMQCAGAPPTGSATDKPDCADQVIVESSGPSAALGYPLSYTTTTTEGAKVLSTVTMEATALTTQPVDTAKYDVPPGYEDVRDARALARAELAAKGEQPKGIGIIRIGVVLPKNSSGAGVEPVAIGNELLDALAVHPYEPVALEATEPAKVDEEAKLRECDYVLFTDLGTAKTTTPGRIGGLMNKVSKSDAKENHEAKVQYRLTAPGMPKPVVEKTTTAKTGAGLNVRTVLNVARLAARLYFGMSGGVMRAMLANANGGAASADPMTNALNMIMTLGAPKQPPANTLEGIILTALQTQSADVMKAIGR